MIRLAVAIMIRAPDNLESHAQLTVSYARQPDSSGIMSRNACQYSPHDLFMWKLAACVGIDVPAGDYTGAAAILPPG